MLTAVECLRSFQVDRYLSTSNFGDSKYWDIGAADYVVPLRNTTPLARTTDHLILLAKLIQMPNKSMDILTSVNEISGQGSENPKDEMPLISLARIIDGVVGWSEDSVHSVRALTQLTRSVMRYALKDIVFG